MVYQRATSNARPLFSAGGYPLSAGGPMWDPTTSPFGESSMYLNEMSGSGDHSADPSRFSTSSAPVERDASNPFAASHRRSGWGVTTWIVIAVGVLIVGGVAAGVVIWQEDKKKTGSAGGSSGSSSSATSSGLQYIPGTAGVVKSDPSDPSNFEKDPSLHNVFYGLAYTPYLTQAPECGATLANVTEDIQLLSQLTTRLRMYGSACNTSGLVLQAIEDTKVNMTVYLGCYIGTNDTVNAQQQAETTAVLQRYGTAHVDGVIIGNEFILGSIDTTQAIDYLIEQMAGYRAILEAANLNVPVGFADAGSEITLKIAEGADFVMSNVHPFFGGLPIAQAADWTWSYYEDTDVSICTAASNKPTCILGETGWPTDSLTVANLTDGGAVASVPNLQTFLDTYICASNANNTAYYFFEPFNEPWCKSLLRVAGCTLLIRCPKPSQKSEAIYGGVEPYWGLANYNKVWKDITFPTC